MDFINGVELTTLKIISNSKGDIFHALKKSDTNFQEFGEAYFSRINYMEIKGWKKHTLMTLNIIVPVGDIKFVMYDDRQESQTCGNYMNITIGEKNYNRLTIPPMIWFAFQGISSNNLLLNIANIEHLKSEAENKSLEQIRFDW